MALVFAVLAVSRERSRRNRMPGLFPCEGGAATPHGVPAEADGSFSREGPVPSVDRRSEGYERRCGFVGGELEVEMTTLLIVAVVVGTLSGLMVRSGGPATAVKQGKMTDAKQTPVVVAV
jgi:hypothetical protein